MIDTHCHLNLSDSFPDMDATVDAALVAGIEALVVVGIERKANDKAIELAEKYPCVWAAVGWHPTEAASFVDSELDHLEESLKHPRVVALGEIGLDYYWDKATKDEQVRCLFAQLEVASGIRKPLGCCPLPNPPPCDGGGSVPLSRTAREGQGGGGQIPVIFHCREAYKDLLVLLQVDHPERFVLHCFAGDEEDAKAAEEMGAYIGIDGPVTFKKNHALRDIVKGYRQDRIVIETDAPFLSPEPFRGKPNSPDRLVWINRAIGGTLGIGEEASDRLTTENAKRLFGL